VSLIFRLIRGGEKVGLIAVLRQLPEHAAKSRIRPQLIEQRGSRKQKQRRMALLDETIHQRKGAVAFFQEGTQKEEVKGSLANFSLCL
jgi:hypothetical protein